MASCESRLLVAVYEINDTPYTRVCFRFDTVFRRQGVDRGTNGREGGREDRKVTRACKEKWDEKRVTRTERREKYKSNLRS